jgi:hypothetical protein
MNIYGEISKVEPQDDGTIKVYGYASTGGLDSQGETVTPDAMKAALPDYMAFGAVREMHQPTAAGTAIEARVQDDGRTWFGAHVVDPIAIKKVQTGTYKGFSIGGKVVSRDPVDPSIITAIRLTEVSLVDRPANPQAVFTMFKAEGTKMTDQTAETVTAAASTLDAAAALDALATLESLLSGELSEAEISPEQIAALRTAIAAVKTFAAAEVQESNEDDHAADLAQAARTGGLGKVGARHSKADKAHMDTIHKALVGMGHCCDAAKSHGAGDLTKMAGDLDQLRKSLGAATAERDGLAARVAELEARPRPVKGVVRVVAKGDDVSTVETDIDALQKRIEKMTPEQQAHQIIKFQMTHGGRAFTG